MDFCLILPLIQQYNIYNMQALQITCRFDLSHNLCKFWMIKSILVIFQANEMAREVSDALSGGMNVFVIGKKSG